MCVPDCHSMLATATTDQAAQAFWNPKLPSCFTDKRAYGVTCV